MYTYKIGDVAEILNMSSEMVRYYEKCGAIHPIRNDNNQYREYSLNDIFTLTECLHYKSWGIKIGDIAGVIRDYTLEDLVKEMTICRKEIDQMVQALVLKSLRINQIIDVQKTFRFNLGNYWVKNIGKEYVFEFAGSSKGSFSESRIIADKMFSKEIFSGDNMLFFDVSMKFTGNSMKWNFIIDADVYHKLGFCNTLVYSEQPEQACLCTVIAIDSFEHFKIDSFESAIRYAEVRGYKINGDVRGVLIGRGYSGQKFCRYFEVQIPILM